MAEWVLKYADPRGEIHQQVAEAGSEQELRDRYTQQGFLIYSIRPRRKSPASAAGQQPPKEAQPRKVPDLQPAVRDADPRRPADSESAGPAGRPPHRPQTRPLHQGRARRGEERRAAFGRLRAPGRISRRST